jgi:hypothetical protein
MYQVYAQWPTAKEDSPFFKLLSSRPSIISTTST